MKKLTKQNTKKLTAPGWCCKMLSLYLTLTVDSQDINELFDGKCPYCHKPAKYGVR